MSTKLKKKENRLIIVVTWSIHVANLQNILATQVKLAGLFDYNLVNGLLGQPATNCYFMAK